MAFRFRRSTRLGPLRLHFGKSGLSSISIGGRGASFNVPVGRRGAPRTTVGLPGTGLSWSVEHDAGPAAGLPNSRRLRPGQLDGFRLACLATLREELFASGSPGHRLWEEQQVTRLLADPALGSRTAGMLALIETPEALETYLLRGRSQDDVKRRARRVIDAVQEALGRCRAHGWL
jgi:hypothetical protein